MVPIWNSSRVTGPTLRVPIVFLRRAGFGIWQQAEQTLLSGRLYASGRSHKGEQVKTPS